MIGPAPDPSPAARGGDTRSRLLATPVILGVIGGVLAIQEFTGNALGTHLVLAAFAAMAGAEFALLLRDAGRPANLLRAAVSCGALGAVGAMGSWPGELMTARVLVLFAALLWVLMMHLRDTRPEAVEEIALGLAPVLTLGLPISFMADFVADWRVLLWILLSAKASDMAGWAIGKPFGRHKMIPSVSPGKSWEGTIAGLVASALAAALLPIPLGLFAGRALPWPALLAFGLLLGAASILAGVLWSGWKRRLGAKDSSSLIPHMGGVTDMLDSLVLAGPAAWVWLHTIGW